MQSWYNEPGDFMAEFCVDCWNKIMGTRDAPKKYIVSKDLDLCEECGQRKQVIVRYKRRYMVADWFHEIIAPQRKRE